MTADVLSALGQKELRGRLYTRTLEDMNYINGGRGKIYLDGYFWLDGENTGYIMYRPTGKIAERHYRQIPLDADIRYLWWNGKG